MTEIRALTEADVPDVLALERAVFSEPWTEAMLRDELEAPDRTYLVGVEGDRVVAYGGLMVVDRDAHVMTLAVAPDRRRHGVASRVLLALVDAALVGGVEHLTLEVRLSNDPARGLYERFGFSPVGVRPGYYRDEDALVMWALDITGPEYTATLDRIREWAA